MNKTIHPLVWFGIYTVSFLWVFSTVLFLVSDKSFTIAFSIFCIAQYIFIVSSIDWYAGMYCSIRKFNQNYHCYIHGSFKKYAIVSSIHDENATLMICRISDIKNMTWDFQKLIDSEKSNRKDN